MTQTVIQKSFAPFRKYLPSFIHKRIRSVATAIIGPLFTAYRTGYFLSCFKMKAVSREGKPIPWYTYPCIDFLKYRSYQDKVVLEFGGGQSTLWWAERAKQVITIEGDKGWFNQMIAEVPYNVDLHYVSGVEKSTITNQVMEILIQKQYSKFDVIIIDGLNRQDMVDIAFRFMASDGMIICDNAEGYGFREAFVESGLKGLIFLEMPQELFFLTALQFT